MNSQPEPGSGSESGSESESLESLAAELERIAPRFPERLDADPEDVGRGLAQLVLTLVEFLRRVLEKQAVRRMEGGSLTDEEVERLGLTLLRLRERMDEIKAAFDLDDGDLSLDAMVTAERSAGGVDEGDVGA